MRTGLIEAAKRGVDIQLLLLEHSNHVTVDWLSKRHFKELLQAGGWIFGHRYIMIRSKTAP